MQADIERLGLDAEWQRTGMLSVATEPHQVDWLRQAADSGEGPLSRSRSRCARRSNSPTYLAGLFSPDSCAIVHPAKLAFELARACTDAGVQIYERTNATGLDTDGSALAGGHRNGDDHGAPGGAGDERLSRACCDATGCTPCRCTTTCWPPSR